MTMDVADERRFRKLVEPELNGLYRMAYRLTHNRADSEDLVQETCIRACRQLSHLSEGRELRGWLLAVMHNLFIDGARRARSSPFAAVTDLQDPDASVSPDPGPEERASIAEREERLHRAWSRLDPGHQMLLALRAEGHSVSEISAIANVPLDALHARLYRARVNLARFLSESADARVGNGLEIAK